MIITTWNSQGDPTGRNDKKVILWNLLQLSDVVMIQECGNMVNLGLFPGINMIYQGQTGALNPRCSTCMLAHGPIFRRDEYGYLRSGNGRWLIIADYRGYVLATLHANAYSGGANDVANALGAMSGDWIMGGDMNCTPYELHDSHKGPYSPPYICSGTTTRPGTIGRIVSSGQFTHPGTNKELDYFVISPSVNFRKIYMHTYLGGDHHPVTIEI